MTIELTGTDPHTGKRVKIRTTRVEVSSEAAGMLREEGREKTRAALELGNRALDLADPEPGDDEIRRRMETANLSYGDAAAELHAERDERRAHRAHLNDPAPEITDQAVRARMEATGEPYADAASAIAAGEGDGRA